MKKEQFPTDFYPKTRIFKIILMKDGPKQIKNAAEVFIVRGETPGRLCETSTAALGLLPVGDFSPNATRC